MTDLPPLEPCPYSDDKRHKMFAIVPGDDDGDITLYCERCVAIRRVPASGSLGGSLDGLTADEIAAAMVQER